MTVEKLELKSNPGATLTAYLLDTSKEMPNMKERPAVLVIPGGRADSHGVRRARIQYLCPALYRGRG